MGAALKMNFGNLGSVDADVAELVANYKKLGFKTKTELVNAALRQLKHEQAAKARKVWREEAAAELKSIKDYNYAWADIDGEDFK
jgi:hypothetical protein